MSTEKPATLLVAPLPADPAAQSPVAPAIVQSTTFVMDAALNEAMARGDYRSQYLYTRMGNPTVRGLERRIAELHGVAEAVATASGMGAVSAALFGLVAPGATLVADTQLYGVTAGFLRRYLEPAGRRVRFVPLADAAALADALAAAGPDAWVLGETVSNPLLRVLDVAGVAQQVHAAGARLMVDNTFAGPLLCAPASLGADVVIESLSKAFAGHSDVHAGAILGTAPDMEACWQAMLHFGACLDPHAAWLVLRGSRTLKLRTDAACSNAHRVARWLSEQSDVVAVWYPGLVAGAQAEVVQRTLQQPGFMVTFAVEGGDARALRLLDALQTVVPATSLGGVESLVSLPFNTSHRTPEARAMIGLQAGTVRLSVGIEDADDLIADLARALEVSADDPG